MKNQHRYTIQTMICAEIIIDAYHEDDAIAQAMQTPISEWQLEAPDGYTITKDEVIPDFDDPARDTMPDFEYRLT